MVTEVRPLSSAELEVVVDALGQRVHYLDRLARQEAGSGEQLVAWLDSRPVGAVFLWLSHIEEPEIARRLPGVPLINNLIVSETRRRCGIGSTLMDQVEARCRALGLDRVALGVNVENTIARVLYDRRGYQQWEHGVLTSTWTAPDEDLPIREFSEECHVLVKRLDDCSS
jgi:ribosomal protein S18 acetylase RimI-like enzyme